MRVGVSSRRNAWVSMGPVGWLILGPFILSFLLIKYLIIAIAFIVVAIVEAVHRYRLTHPR